MSRSNNAVRDQLQPIELLECKLDLWKLSTQKGALLVNNRAEWTILVPLYETRCKQNHGVQTQHDLSGGLTELDTKNDT